MPRMTRRGDKAATPQKAPRRKGRPTETLEAYPILEPFTTMDQVRTYLDGTCITCLLCGKKLKALASHLWKVHGIGPDVYRERYGIPWTFGLVPSATKDKIVRAQKARVANGTCPILSPTGQAEARELARHTQRRPAQVATQELNRAKLEAVQPVEGRCTCGKSFTKGPHSMKKTLCDECYRAKYPWATLKEVEFTCEACGASGTKGPTSKRTTCRECIKKAHRERKNARRRKEPA